MHKKLAGGKQLVLWGKWKFLHTQEVQDMGKEYLT